MGRMSPLDRKIYWYNYRESFRRKTLHRHLSFLLFDKLESIYAKDDFTKALVVEAFKEFIPIFEHEEKGKNLDQKDVMTFKSFIKGMCQFCSYVFVLQRPHR